LFRRGSKFDIESSKIKVLFCRDGDVEHISKDNAIKIASISATVSAELFHNVGLIKVGDNVSKYFCTNNGKSHKFTGKVIKFNPVSNSVFIRYDEDEEEEEVEMNEAWHLLESDRRCVPGIAAIPTTSQPTTSTENRARISFSPIPYANSPHARSAVATKEIVDLCSSPESAESEENTEASPDLTVVKAALQLQSVREKKAELMLTIAQMEAKAKKRPTKKRADDNTSQRAAPSNVSNGGEPKRFKVKEEVKVKEEEEEEG
jgi:hypothetical protein